MQDCMAELSAISPSAAPFQVKLGAPARLHGAELRVPAFVFVRPGHAAFVRALAPLLPWLPTDDATRQPVTLKLKVIDIYMRQMREAMQASLDTPAHTLRILPGYPVVAVVAQHPSSLLNVAHVPGSEAASEAIVLQLQDSNGLPATLAPADAVLAGRSKQRVKVPLRFPSGELRLPPELPSGAHAALLAASAAELFKSWALDTERSLLTFGAEIARVPLMPADWAAHDGGIDCSLTFALREAMPASGAALAWQPLAQELGPDLQPLDVPVQPASTVVLQPTQAPTSIAVLGSDDSSTTVSTDCAPSHGLERTWQVECAAGDELQGALLRWHCGAAVLRLPPTMFMDACTRPVQRLRMLRVRLSIIALLAMHART